jgi:hypothetical protein
MKLFFNFIIFLIGQSIKQVIAIGVLCFTIAGGLTYIESKLTLIQRILSQPVYVFCFISILFFLICIFLFITHKSWALKNGIVVVDYKPDKMRRGNYIFVIKSNMMMREGIIIELNKTEGLFREPFALIEVEESDSPYYVQASALWIAPYQKYFLKNKSLDPKKIRCAPFLRSRTLQRALNDRGGKTLWQLQ